MEFSHKIKNISGNNVIYIFVKVEDIYEFGKENLGKGEDSNFLSKLKSYIKANYLETKKMAAVLVINGVVIGTLSFANILNNDVKKNTNKTPANATNNYTNVSVYKEKKDSSSEETIAHNFIDKEDSIEDKEKNTHNEIINEKEEKKEEKKTKIEIVEKKQSTTNIAASNSSTNSQNITNTKKENTNTNTTSTTSTSSNNEAKQENESNKSATKEEEKEETNSKNTENTTNDTNTTNSTTNNTDKPQTTNNTNTSISNNDIVISLKTGGNVIDIELEKYIIGVVAAEMPASFSTEALKAQAVAARTYAMKKHDKGQTLVNSTANQVYYTEAQMKSLWGASYSTYFNKIKNAVNSTKGEVLKYNGDYIEALFYAISNGKSELPKYVWSSNYPYLTAVSSTWDENISAGKYSIDLSYEKLSKSLGVNVNKDSEIKILSRTEGDRVNEISIAGKLFTGVKVRNILGLRSADFEIIQNENNVTIKTIGFGHGVGMSQYGANGAAKAGLSYREILSHYYPGAKISKIS